MPRVHQAVEFGNRLISIAVVVAAVLAVLAVTRRAAGPKCWCMPG
ncbi:hypothetical protein I553_10013 [Mycobacterium xenopi 4042]|uniref:Uncharacterized protein n=1 Tax=Mycobacterium xenopi 4042 TaxID=1299334 RepID=X7YQ86_MYCXE|nr:hypothetical protein I553_10013 [Mycobacterium xenopi 4042]